VLESQSEAARAAHEDLVRAGVLLPVEIGGAEERTWLDCELASFAENRLGDLADPGDIDDARRADWQARAIEETLWSLRERSAYQSCYWVIEDGARAGTVALAPASLGNRCLRLSSLYVLPSHRRRQTGRRIMHAVRDALANRGLGLRLDTSWCWQRAVRFYLGLGMWVYMWKREIDFYWGPWTPDPRIDVGDATASLSVHVDGAEHVLVRAERRGDALWLDDAKPDAGAGKRVHEAWCLATSTLALALALRGWPLIRSAQDFERYCYSDAIAPESLARKIGVWEARHAGKGWSLQTPRLPGVEYPTWAELEARWAAEEAEWRAQTKPSG
jgi:GNAT superfamily N-acetyltransferase